MRPLPFAGFLGLAALGAHAQFAPPPYPFAPAPSEPVVVTASRTLVAAPTLRDAIVITREDLEASGSLSLAEVLQRRAGIEVRGTGGPGQPQGLFIRGASSAQTLVLVDGLRVGSATVGTTSIENIPIDLVERIEVVKGPLSSLYGSEAMGGVIQIFTRGKTVPHLFATASYGTDADRRLSAGVASVDGKSTFSAAIGGRRVDAPSATTDRVAFCHDPDRDPYENAFGNLRATHRLWQGEVLEVEAFATRGRTHFDGCGTDDRNDQTISGARFTSSSDFTRDWSSRVAIGEGRDELQIHGAFPSRFETRQTQVAWINEFAIPAGKMVAGYEVLRQRVRSDESTVFAQTERDTRSLFAGINETWGIQRLEASIRRDDDDAFGKRDTGSLTYGYMWEGVGLLSGTWARGFRAPTFYDLYGPTSDFYQPNPALKPEHNKSSEISLRGAERFLGMSWRVTAFDNRIEDLIAYSFPTVENVNRARIRGVELHADGKAWGGSWTASFTAQKPRDETTGARLQSRAERFGSFNAERRFGEWGLGLTVTASGDRFDSANEAPESRLGGYAVVDARVAWRYDKFTRLELAVTNLGDKRYESAVGYESTRRSVLLSVRFDAF
jgi:vitamin B12 transporter